jgi:hypothetical protein
LGDEPTEGLDPGGLFAAAKDLGTVHIKRRQVGPRSASRIFVLNAGGTVRTRWRGGMLADAGLNAGFLVGAEHKLIGTQSFALPTLGVKIEDASGLAREIWVAREDPGTMLPGEWRPRATNATPWCR